MPNQKQGDQKQVEQKKEWYIRTEAGSVYGPATVSSLVTWAEEGRIEPSSFVSRDRISWIPVQMMAELEMKWLVETEPGKVFGPFNRALVADLFEKDRVPKGAKAYRLHEFPIREDAPPKIVEVEKIVEKVVEKIVEVPVEKIVEKVIEVEPPPRTTLTVPEVVEPVDKMPPRAAPGSVFGNIDRNRLAALEAAAQRELASARSGKFGWNPFGKDRR